MSQDPALGARYKNPDNDPRGPYLLSDITSPLELPLLQYAWHGQVPPAGRSWRYKLERVQQLEAEGCIAFSSSGWPRLKRYLSEVHAPKALPLSSHPLGRLDLILRPAMRAIARLVAENPIYLLHIEWRDLERVLREVFEGLGFSTELTRSSKDGGFDLRLELVERGRPIVFLVEVKHWINSNKRPGPGEVNALFDMVVRTAEAGLILSSNGFTKKAVSGRTEVQQQLIRLGGKEKIASLCQEYLRSEAGIWAPSTDLAELLVQDTH